MQNKNGFLVLFYWSTQAQGKFDELLLDLEQRLTDIVTKNPS